MKFKIKEFIHQLIIEVSQAFLIISLISYLKPTIKFNFNFVLRYSIIMGIIFTCLGFYNDDMLDKAKGGMIFSLGTSFMN